MEGNTVGTEVHRCFSSCGHHDFSGINSLVICKELLYWSFIEIMFIPIELLSNRESSFYEIPEYMMNERICLVSS